jgi:aryl-alcohol dehydrogenase-like predicted oxidoreductase
MTDTVMLGDLEVSTLGLGCMGMSEFYGPGDDQVSMEVLDRALELGISFLDTADMYGHGDNEELLGRWLADRSGVRDEVTLATKFGIVRDRNDPTVRGLNGRPEYVHRSCDGSLQRLGVDEIDLYYLHRPDPQVPIEETVGAMEELRTAGKVRHLGLSEASADTIRRAEATAPITAVQTEWSLWSRDIEDRVVPVCRELGIGVVAYSPLGRGFLTGAITSEDDLDDDDWRKGSPRFTGEAFQANLAVVRRAEQLAGDLGITPAQLALAWVMAQSSEELPVVPIPGTKRTSYLEDNAAARAVQLSADELAMIEEFVPPKDFEGDRYPSNAFTEIDTPSARS